MNVRNHAAPRLIRAAMLLAALVFLGHTAEAQTLTASANPASGAAGVNSTTITGSGFPAGVITGATAHFAATCAAPALVSAPVAQVTAVTVLRRFQFLIPASLAPGTYRVWVSGTAGTTPFNTINKPSCATLIVTSSVQGTASLGAAIAGAEVTLVDALGNTRTGTTASDGTFALSTGGLVPPFLVRVVTTAPSGSFPAGTTLYSVSADGNASTRINVHVLTDLLVRSFYSAQDIDPDAAFSNPVGDNAAPNPAAVQAIANLVVPAVQLWLDNAGVDATPGAPGDGAINLISSNFIAYPPGTTPPGGLDAVLHQITAELVDPADGSISAITIVGGTLTEVIQPEYGSNLITLNTTTTNSATGAGTTGSFSGLALTAALQPVADGITATLTAFKNTVNAEGAGLTASDLLPFYASDYLDGGRTAAIDAAETADELAGATIDRLEIVGIESVSGGVAYVVIRFVSGPNDGLDVIVFKEQGGSWLLYGDQRIGDIGVSVGARRHQGGAGLFSGTVASASASAPHGVITSATVTGPTNLPGSTIWDGLASRPLFQFAQTLENGQAFDEFGRLSQPLGNTLAEVMAQVPVTSDFAIDLVTTTVGNVHYDLKVENKAYTTETMQFTAIPLSRPLTQVLGNTLNFTFTVPQTFPVGGVFLFAYLYDGLPNNPNAHTCSIGADAELTLDFTSHTGSGSITFPTTLAPCGLNTPIVFINVFLDAEGTNGEDTIVQYALPY